MVVNMIDFSIILDLPKLHKVAYLLLFTAVVISMTGHLHQLLYLNKFKNIQTESHLVEFAWFVRIQMVCALLMLAFMVPAVIFGAINGAENLVVALGTYAFIFINGKIFSRAENSFKKSFSRNPDFDAQIKNMVYQWDNKALPTFRA